jgi:hypothetical protein
VENFPSKKEIQAATYNQRAVVHTNMKHYSVTLSNYERAYTIASTTFPNDHPTLYLYKKNYEVMKSHCAKSATSTEHKQTKTLHFNNDHNEQNKSQEVNDDNSLNASTLHLSKFPSASDYPGSDSNRKSFEKLKNQLKKAAKQEHTYNASPLSSSSNSSDKTSETKKDHPLLLHSLNDYDELSLSSSSEKEAELC